VLDIVPNHMATDDANRFWADRSLREQFFDIDEVTGRHRRFFDIDHLAALRQEDPAVFEATHTLALKLVREGIVDGLRIDHPDGGALDISAPVPEHFAASLDALGFDPLLGDALAEEAPRPSAKTVQKTKAKAHAKQVRKARRGERRGRAEAKAKPKTPAKRGPAKPGGRKPAPRKPR